MNRSTPLQNTDPSLGGIKLKMLDMEQVHRIDEMLDSLGDYGELHLVVQHSELRYINKVESYRASRNTGHSGRSV